MSSDAVSPGDILHLYIGVIDPPKPKFCVVACLDPKVILLLINSEPAPFIQQNPELMNCQVVIDQRTHSFLDYDSWINCTHPIGYDIGDIEQYLASDSAKRKGHVSDAVKEQIKKAIIASPLVSPRQTGWIINSLR